MTVRDTTELEPTVMHLGLNLQPSFLERFADFRDQALHSHAGKAMVALTAGLSLGIPAEAIPQPATPDETIATVAAKPRLMRPSSMMKGIQVGYAQTYGDSNTFDATNTSLSRRHLVINGKCHPGQRFPDTKKIDDNSKTQSGVYCNGLSLTRRRQDLGSSLEKIDYKPLLKKLGQRAARSSGVVDSDHSTAIYVAATRKKMTVVYSRNTAASTHQLNKLTFTINGTKETVSKTWY